MPSYVTLINWTDQGVKNFKDSVDRYEAAQAAMGRRNRNGGAAGSGRTGQRPDNDHARLQRQRDAGDHRESDLTSGTVSRSQSSSVKPEVGGAPPSAGRRRCVPARQPQAQDWVRG